MFEAGVFFVFVFLNNIIISNYDVKNKYIGEQVDSQEILFQNALFQTKFYEKVHNVAKKCGLNEAINKKNPEWCGVWQFCILYFLFETE